MRAIFLFFLVWRIFFFFPLMLLFYFDTSTANCKTTHTAYTTNRCLNITTFFPLDYIITVSVSTILSSLQSLTTTNSLAVHKSKSHAVIMFDCLSNNTCNRLMVEFPNNFWLSLVQKFNSSNRNCVFPHYLSLYRWFDWNSLKKSWISILNFLFGLRRWLSMRFLFVYVMSKIFVFPELLHSGLVQRAQHITEIFQMNF